MHRAFRSRITVFEAVTPEDMAARVMTFAPASEAEALKLLRARFPRSSLRMRVTALDFLLRRRPRGFGQAYRPR